VGPRPLVIDEDRHVTGFDRRRLHLTPGITGRWQTLGASRVPLSEMVKIDYLYIANWSPWTDLRIMIETVEYMLRAARAVNATSQLRSVRAAVLERLVDVHARPRTPPAMVRASRKRPLASTCAASTART